MKDWYIEDRNNEVYVLHGEKYTSKKQIYPSDGNTANVKFYLLYNEEYKTVGYQIEYLYSEKFPKFMTYNSFGVVYNKRKTNFKTTLEVIFEDAIVRFLAYEHSPTNVRDYFLVGRWRNSSAKEEYSSCEKS